MTTHLAITVDYSNDGQSLRVKFPYDPQLVSLIKTIPGRKALFDKEKRFICWTIPSYTLRHLQSAGARVGVDVEVSPQVAKAAIEGLAARSELTELKYASDATLNLPTTTVPYDFQRAGISFLLQSLNSFHGALLASDMGLGKTFQALSAVILNPDFKRVLVLCPASTKYNWAAEIEKHYPQLTYTVIDGPADERDALWRNVTVITIANYELLLRDDHPKRTRWDFIICDEIQRIKSYKAKTSKLTKSLKRQHSLGLSGTPVENRLEELHSIFDFCMPGLLGPGWLFVWEHCIKDGYGNTVGYRGLEKVRQRIEPHYLRHTKAQVLPQLPPKIYNDLWLELTSPEWTLYDAIKQQIAEWIQINPILTTANILTEMLRLKQATDHPKLLGEELPSTKLAALEELLEAGEGHKVVVFTQFAQMAHILVDRFKAPLIEGATPAKERTEIAKDFAINKEQLLVCTDAGNLGLSFLGPDIVVHYDLLWNPQRMRQREDRLHGLGRGPGTEGNVQVVRLLTRRTIDTYILNILHKKLKLAAAIFSNTDEIETAQQITRNDLLEALGIK